MRNTIDLTRGISIFRSLVPVTLGLVLVGCAKPQPSPSGFTGLVALGGPVSGAKVQMSPINADGSLGTSFCSATSDSAGVFTCTKSASLTGSVMVTATGGSYTDLVTNSSVSLGSQSLSAVIQTVATTATQNITITSLTDIASGWEQQLVAQNAMLSVFTGLSDGNLRLALGWSTQTRLDELPPTVVASGMKTDFSNIDENGHYVLLAAVSQLASMSGRTSAQIEAALKADFSDGVFDGKDSTGASVNYGSVSGFAALSSALTTYLASKQNPGFNSTNLPAFTAMLSAPPIPLQPYNVLTPVFGSSSLTISWNSAVSASDYNVTVSTDPQCASPGSPNTDTTLTSFQIPFTSLIHGSTYYVCMIAEEGSQIEEPNNSTGGNNYSFSYP